MILDWPKMFWQLATSILFGRWMDSWIAGVFMFCNIMVLYHAVSREDQP